MEFSTGKLAVEDYETQRERRERELESAESELEELAGGDDPRGPTPRPIPTTSSSG